ncbi:MAG: hypothetical protein CSA96_07185 [Bacteroidetes bacterium]|nr:MAG: hypothetical protein CSA96_07185 [Bacteroidota bacterium]
MVNTPYSIILGAEGELGRAMALEVARKGCNLIMLSITEARLEPYAKKLQESEGVQVEARQINLKDDEAVKNLANAFGREYEIRALINNICCDWSVEEKRCISEIAGNDLHARFEGASLFNATLLPYMKALSSAYIQHIIPFPFGRIKFDPELQKSVTLMYAFALELKEHLRNSTVSVSMMHPAPAKGLGQEHAGSKVSQEPGMNPGLSNIALKAVNGMLKGNGRIIPGFRNWLQFTLSRTPGVWA